MTQEALKLALQTLELSKETMKAACKQIDELKAENKLLKETLAVDKESLTTETQPEQEPAKDWVASHNVICALLRQAHDALALTSYPMMRTWVGLTDEERSQLVTLHHGWNEYAQAIEAKLKDKNNA